MTALPSDDRMEPTERERFTFWPDGAAEPLQCELLPCDVRLASLRSSHARAALHELAGALFFSDTCRFAAYVDDGEEGSLAVDAACMPQLDNAVVDPDAFAGVQIFEGETALDMCGVVSQITRCLADTDVPILYISTYYSDIVLVPAAQLDRTLALLQRESPTAGPSAGGAAMCGATLQCAPTAQLLPSRRNSEASVHLSPMPSPLRLIRVPDEHRSACTHAAMRALFYDRPGFCSMTRTSAALSLLVSAHAAAWFPAGLHHQHTSTWCAVRLSKGAVPLSDSALVAAVAPPLARASIPIYYSSAFDSDFVLVPQPALARAVHTLRDQLRASVDEAEGVGCQETMAEQAVGQQAMVEQVVTEQAAEAVALSFQRVSDGASSVHDIDSSPSRSQ